MADKSIFNIKIIPTSGPELSSDNRQGDSKQIDIIRLEGFEGISELYSFRLQITHNHEPNQFLEMQKMIGAEVKIKINDPEERKKEPLRYVNGYIRTINIKQLKMISNITSHYHLEVVPKLYFLQETRDCAIFQNKSAVDIIEAVLKKYKITSDIKLSGTYYKYDYCVQYQESHYNFIQRLMEREGIYYYFDHQDGITSLKIRDKMPYEPIDGNPKIKFGNFVPFNPLTHKKEEREPVITEWGYRENFFIPKVMKGDYNYLLPTKKGYYTKPDAAPIPGGVPKLPEFMENLDIFDYPAKFRDNITEAKTFKEVHEQRLQTYKNIFEGLSNSIALRPGFHFQLDKFSDKNQNKEYLVTNLHFLIVAQDIGQTKERDGYNDSEKGVEFRFLAIPADRQFRPQLTTPRPRIDGVQTARVVVPEGQEIYTDALGRVKVVFHWDRELLAEANGNGKESNGSSGDQQKQEKPKPENRSCWIRVAQSLAGQKWGSQFIPRKDQEVVVTFIDGDPDRPLITGVVYNSNHGLPYAPSNPKKSKEEGGSSQKSQDNPVKDGEEEALNGVAGKEDDKFATGILTHPEGETQPDLKTLNNFNEIHFYDKAGQELVRIVGKKDFKALINQNSDTEIKGSMTEKVGGSRTENVGSDYKLTIGSTREETVTSSDKLTVNDSKETTVSSSYTIKAQSFTVEAKSSIKLVVGGSTIEITPGGIIINGPEVKIN